MRTISIDIWGFDMEVSYEYQEEIAGTWDEPGEREHCDVHSVLVGGVDIYEMLSGKQLARIEEATLRAHNDESAEFVLDMAINRAEAA